MRLYDSPIETITLPASSNHNLTLVLVLQPQVIPGDNHAGSGAEAQAELYSTIFSACVLHTSQLQVSYAVSDISVRIFGIRVSLPKSVRVDGTAQTHC